MAQVDKDVGRVIYTPVLDYDGGFRRDLTIVRLGREHFRVATGGADGSRERKWFVDHLPTDGSVNFADIASATCTIGLRGPLARDALAANTDRDRSTGNDGFAP